jgi:hypothetical protein
MSILILKLIYYFFYFSFFLNENIRVRLFIICNIIKMNFIHQPFKKGLNLFKNLSKNTNQILRNFTNDESNNKPFALFDQQSPYILPNPFKIFFQKLNLRWEMSRIDPSFNLEDFYYGTKMVIFKIF